jgi:hypothetical protein
LNGKDIKVDQTLPTKWEIPLFQQLTNSCGLASILMLMDPKKNPKLQEILDNIGELINPLILKILPLNESEFTYQYVLQYLLLKALSRNSDEYQFLTDYLTEEFENSYENQKLISNFKLAESHQKFIEHEMFAIAKAYDRYILEGNTIPRLMLKNETFSVKNDMDLKILMSIFGYDFIPFNSTNGALVYNKKNKNFLENLCKSHIDPENRILFGDGKHWQALTGLYTNNLDKWVIKNEKIAPKTSLNDYTIVYNDPIIPKQHSMPLKEIVSQQFFYVFKRKKGDHSILWDRIQSAIAQDITNELDETIVNKNKRTGKNFNEMDETIIGDDDLF